MQVTIATTPTLVIGRNSRRLSVTFFNASLLGEVISLTKNGVAGLAENNREYVLQPNQGIGFMLDFDGADIQGEWGAYADAATALLVVGECAIRER